MTRRSTSTTGTRRCSPTRPQPADFAATAPAEHDLAGIFYTGGTTGAAKGVMLTHGNLVANAFHFMACWPFTPDTRWLVVAPMFHAAGTIGVLATIWAGGTQVMCRRFDPDGALDLVERHGDHRDARRADDDGRAGRRADGPAARGVDRCSCSATAGRRRPPSCCAAPTPPSPTPRCCTSTG